MGAASRATPALAAAADVVAARAVLFRLLVQHDVSRAIWEAAEHALLRTAALDDAARDPIWAALTKGELAIEARCSTRARVTFLARRRAAALRDPLDARTRTVAELVGTGMSYKEIAFELGVSNASVWRAIASACRSLGVGERIELAIVSAAFGPGRRGGHRSVRCASIRASGGQLVVLDASMAASPLWDRLSEAERAVTELALAGHPGATIAHLRGARSARTVANQLDQVFRKAGVSGRAQLATRLVAG